MLISDFILEGYKAREIADELGFTDEDGEIKGALEYFRGLCDGEFEESKQVPAFSKFVENIDAGAEMWYCYGAGHYFAVVNA